MSKLTDNQIALLYNQLDKDFKELNKTNTTQACWDTLYHQVQNTLSNPNSSLYNLDKNESNKVYEILGVVVDSYPNQNNFKKPRNIYTYEPIINNFIVMQNHSCYCRHDDTLFLAMVLAASNHHHSYSGLNSDMNTNDPRVLLFMLLVIILAILASLALIALIYTLSQTLGSMERLLHNEGWLHAAITVLSGAAGAAIGGAGGLIIALGLAGLTAGLVSPVGVFVFTAICCAIIGMGAAEFAGRQLLPYLLQKYNKDALAPEDPYRFRLTPDEEKKLEKNGISPVAVKCAMVAIREKLQGEDFTPMLKRLFSSEGREKQKLLNDLRAMRKGKLTQITIGGKGEEQRVFDLRKESDELELDVVVNPNNSYPNNCYQTPVYILQN